ncbi:MAG TPA: hypothetical protein VLA56_18920 [Pseudomonadales bacterium]|nr:hypothetical protein [Pseudomonadales bacterium]
MLILRVGLHVSIAMALLATWMSSSSGYPIEVAMVRGLLAFMAGSLVSYVAELIVMTAPPPQRQPRQVAHDEDDDELARPASLPAIRSERDSALDDSRAA